MIELRAENEALRKELAVSPAGRNRLTISAANAYAATQHTSNW